MTSITYTVGTYGQEDNTVQVTYANTEGNTHVRTINIPHLENGTIDEDGLQDILEGQLRGVKNKVSLGVIQFSPVGIAST